MGVFWSAIAGAVVLALLALPPEPSWAQSQSQPAASERPASAAPAAKAKQSKSGKGGKKGGRRGSNAVVVDPVRVVPVTDTIPVYGRLVARQAGVVASRTKGAVGQVHARVGDRVRQGDPLISLVTDTLQAERALRDAELREFSAKIQTADAQLALSEQELARLNRLRHSSAYSPARYQDKLRDVERFRSAKAEAQAKAEQARAQLSMADINLGYAEIRAPFGGVISQRHVELGAYLSVGDKVITLINDTELEVEAEVPSVRLAGLATGTPVEVRPEMGVPFKASVRAIVPEENPLSRTRTVRFVPQVDQRGARLAANQSVVLQIPVSAPRAALTVHKDSVIQRRGEPVVFAIVDDLAQLRSVRLGAAVAGRFEVLQGLKAGEAVVIRGNERLNDGQGVTVSAEPGGGSLPETDATKSTSGQGGS